MKSIKSRLLAGVALASVGTASFAQAIDVSSVTSALTSVGAAVATVGAAVLVVYVGVKSYKMIRAAL